MSTRLSVKRDIGGSPRRVPSTSIDQVMSMESGTMDGQARVLVFFRGRVDEARMERAVRLTLEAEPLLGYRFVHHVRRPYWEEVDEDSWDEHFILFRGSPSDPAFMDFMVAPVRPERAPQIKAGLFRSENDVLCVRSSHMAVDGGGAVQYLALLASVYRELERDPGYRPAVNNRGRAGPRQVLRRTGPLPAIRALTRTQWPGAEWGVPGTGGDLSRQSFEIRQIGPERLEAVRAYARGKGATVNDVLLTAFIRSLFATCDPPKGEPLRVEVPTNLRKYLPESEARVIGDLSAVYFLAIERREEGFEDTLKRVHESIERKKGDRTELGEMFALELALLPGLFFLRKLKELADFEIAHPVLSNLGAIDPSAADFGSAIVEDVQMFGPTQFPPNIGMGVSTFRQRTTLSISYCSSAVDPALIGRIIDLTLDALPGR